MSTTPRWPGCAPCNTVADCVIFDIDIRSASGSLKGRGLGASEVNTLSSVSFFGREKVEKID